MCGISGLWGPQTDQAQHIAAGCLRMRHRGPDSQGIWQDNECGLTLGHVRLAILDLSDAGHQPMLSSCGRYALVLNGEIYNHLALRTTLANEGNAPVWRGHSDTETLLAAFAAWGMRKTLQASTGMFALALWDKLDKTLTLARDRFGEKPLYYGLSRGSLVFGSELKALMPIPGFGQQINRQALTLLLRHNYIPAPLSIYEGIFKLSPGSYLQIGRTEIQEQELGEPEVYWSAAKVAQSGQAEPLSFSVDQQAVDLLEATLAKAVQGQMLADVPLGAFLSGGVDSSLIVALMQRQSSQPVRSFAIGFDEPAYDEAPYAQAVAQHLGTEHTALYVSSREALDVVPTLADLYDEPFADSSQIPTALVARMARQQVTVALSGDGGDELFGGYTRYQRIERWWRQCSRLPGPLRRPLGSLLSASESLPGSGVWRGKLAKLGDMLGAPNQALFYRQFVSYWSSPESLVIGGSEPRSAFHEDFSGHAIHAMMALDAVTYLPDDILCKVDRAAMAVGLETRVPLLDQAVYELAWRLPLSYKIRKGQSKWILRQVLYKHVPQALIDRPKKGFAVPLAKWLRGPLKDWAQALLEPRLLREQGLFVVEPILQKWREHQTSQRDWSAQLWGILMVQAWLERHQESLALQPKGGV